VTLLCAFLTPRSLRAQAGLQPALTVQSVSGQFLVQAPRLPGLPVAARGLQTNENLVRLDLSLLPVSVERIKQAVWGELGVSAPWQGKIRLNLHAATSPDEGVVIASDHFPGGWRYRVELPDLLRRDRYVRALVQVLLLELANRNAGERCAEIPLWLTEGLTQQLLASNSIELILQPPRTMSSGIAITSTYVSARRADPLERARALVNEQGALTFSQLSWPEGDLEGESGAMFRSSAQLFVAGLLGLEQGRANLRAMVEELALYYNWQMAFLHAYRARFEVPLDVEKWWALQSTQSIGRELGQTWVAAASWEKLSQVVRAGVEIRTGTNEPVQRAEVSLQTIIRDWELEPQAQALREKLQELGLLRLRIAPEFVGLVDEYQKAIQDFLHGREHPGLVLPFRKKAAEELLVAETVRQLNALDAKRLKLKPAVMPGALPQSQPAVASDASALPQKGAAPQP
jgi:hypothetical protein